VVFTRQARVIASSKLTRSKTEGWASCGDEIPYSKQRRLDVATKQARIH
jgi:hypothetical protein